MTPSPSVQISHGMNLKDGLTLARTIGCRVQPRRRTGEIQVLDPTSRKRVLVNGRRKDSPRALTQFLKAMARVA